MEHIIFMVEENVTMTRKELNKKIEDSKDNGHSDGCYSGGIIWLFIGMALMFIICFCTICDKNLDTSYKQEACFNAVGDYKFIYENGDSYCVVTHSPTKISLYKLVAYNEKWVVSREATVLDGVNSDFYD